MIYLDYNATTPVDPRVADAMRPFLDGGFGNPSSAHRLGREARAAVDRAREQVAVCLGGDPDEVVFTSGGSESDNLALCGVLDLVPGRHLVTSAVEHPAVLETALALELSGRARMTLVDVDQHGVVDPEAVERGLRPDTAIVSLMLANNEVGTLQPVAEVARRCRERGVLVHTDAAQAVGKIRVDVRELGVDLLTVAGHKLYAPKGVGALYVRRGVQLEPQVRGAGHERGLRAGTENVLGIVGLGAACELAGAGLAAETPRLAALRDRLEARLRSGFPGLVVHGHPARRLPNTASVSFPRLDASRLLALLADTVAVSAGAACHGDQVKASHVLLAMGVPVEVAMGTLRLSAGRFTTEADVDRGAELVLEAVRRVGSAPV